MKHLILILALTVFGFAGMAKEQRDLLQKEAKETGLSQALVKNFSELGFPEDRPILCIPVISNDKIRCIILASENKKGELLDMLEMYSLLVKKLSLAFELLVLKNQILDLSEVET